MAHAWIVPMIQIILHQGNYDKLKSYSEQFIFPIKPYNNIQNMFWLFMVATPIKVALLETESHNETHDLGK